MPDHEADLRDALLTEDERRELAELSERSAIRGHQGALKAQLRELSYRELIQDRVLLDQAVRAVCMERDCDYVTALEQLERWHGWASQHGEASVADVIDKGMSLDCFAADVAEMQYGTREEAIAAELADAAPPEPEGELDDHGQVCLADASPGHRARLLTDPETREAAFLEARDLGFYDDDGADEARERFERDLRTHVEQGLDLIGNLRFRRRADAERRARDERMADQLHAEALERERRAERRRIDAEAEELRKRARRL